MKIENIIIHCADTPNGKAFHAKDIDDWHKERGFKRGDLWIQQFNSDFHHIGYHLVITVSGIIETGRQIGEVGSHCQGNNTASIGICMIGKDRFTTAQWDALKTILEKLREDYPSAAIHGHRYYKSAKEQGKTCPNWDVDSYVADGCVPDERHIL